MVLVEVDKFPKMAVHNWRYEILDMENEIPAILTLIEKKWREMEDDNERDPDEMEKRSAPD